MARKYKLNKSELTRLKREEKTFLQFLPVLKLKQEQLQIEQLKVRRQLRQAQAELERAKADCMSVVALLPDPSALDVVGLCRARKFVVGEKSVAGVRVPTLEKVEYPDFQLSRFGSPPWLVRGLSKLRDLVKASAEISILKQQFDAITRELKKSTQKVNLFEKVLIPETKEAIKRIKIALGDEQVAAVGRGKIAKSKSIDLSPLVEVASAGSM